MICKLNIKEKLGLFSVLVCINYHPLVQWILHLDGAGRVPFVLYMLSFILLFRKLIRTAIKVPIIFYILLTLFQFCNALIKGSPLLEESSYLLIVHLLCPLITMLVVTHCARRKFNYTLRLCTIGLFIYSCFCIVFSGLFSIERTDADINANEIALYSAINVGLFLLCYVRRLISFNKLLFVAIPLILVVITGSKMGFAMVALMFVGLWVNMVSNKSLSYKLKGFIVLAIMLSALIYILNHFEVGSRFEEMNDINQNLVTGTVLDNFGDRGAQYYFSWPVFKEHPVTGIGIGNWSQLNPTGHVCHSEYLVQYLEGGLICFSLFILFWIYLFKKLKLRKKFIHNSTLDKGTINLMYFILASIIFSNSVLWSYDMHCVFIVYALVLGFCPTGQKYRRYKLVLKNDESSKK